MCLAQGQNAVSLVYDVDLNLILMSTKIRTAAKIYLLTFKFVARLSLNIDPLQNK